MAITLRSVKGSPLTWDEGDDNFREVQSLMDKVSVSVTDYGAVGDGVTDDTAAVNTASNAVGSNGYGEVLFPSGLYNFTFTQPPYNITWNFLGTDIGRDDLGGENADVRFLRPKLTYVDGPHETQQYQVEHNRVIAKGSNAIGAQYADYAMGITIEKENWSESSGNPVAGEINAITIFTRNGCLDDDPVKTGGAAVLANIGQTADSGYTQFLESLNSVYTKGTLAVEKQTNLQLQGIDEKTSDSWGVILNSVVGTQTSAIRVSNGTTEGSAWGYILQNYKSSVLNFWINDEGKIKFRQNSKDSFIEPEAATGDLVVKNNDADIVARFSQTTGNLITNNYYKAVDTTLTNAYTLTEADNCSFIGLYNDPEGSAITVTLPNSLSSGFSVKIMQRGADQITFAAASGAILRNVDSQTKTKGQYAVCELLVSTNVGGNAAVYYLTGQTGT